MKILLVKLSSLGDVLHNLPIVWDIRVRYPDAQIDWVTEEAYVDLLTPLKTQNGFRGIDRIIPVALRRWKKNKFNFKTLKNSLGEFKKFREQLRSTTYDLIIETQGLIKSAIIARLAKRSENGVIAGLANRTALSSYEPLVRWFYTQKIQAPTQSRAIDRSRFVAAAAIGVPYADIANSQPQFYSKTFISSLIQNRFSEPYALFFHATSREDKRWADANWIAIGKALAKNGLTIILPWGNPIEKKISEQLAAQIPNAIVPEPFSIQEALGLIARAALVIGVDTGFTHISAAFCKPTIEIYCATTRWRYEGYWSDQIKNLGDIGAPPSVEEVLRAARAYNT